MAALLRFFFLKRNWETLQGSAKAVKGARSATNVYSYNYSSCGRAVVVTFDLSAENLSTLALRPLAEQSSECRDVVVDTDSL